MWHLICGDAAAEGVRFALGNDVAEESLRVMRDDLAVGPLEDVDTPPCSVRSAYWQGVWPQSEQPVPDFTAGLSEDARWLVGLATGERAVTVWHGDSCSEQLLLARLAHALAGSAVELWEVACGNPQVSPRRAVSLRRPEELPALYQQRLELDANRRVLLAEQWQQAKHHNAAIRTWYAGSFQHCEYGLLDKPLLHACTAAWQPLARVMAGVMAQSDGFFPTDFFLHWRARELAQAGLLELALPMACAYAEQQVRLPTTR
jgi:hypothetical protein